jgi:hypothetical protein
LLVRDGEDAIDGGHVLIWAGGDDRVGRGGIDAGDREKLLAARVEIEYEHASPVFNPLRSSRALKRFVIEKGDLERGFDALFLHEVGPQQRRFVEAFGRELAGLIESAIDALPDGCLQAKAALSILEEFLTALQPLADAHIRAIPIHS